jgi:hypothetical protein
MPFGQIPKADIDRIEKEEKSKAKYKPRKKTTAKPKAQAPKKTPAEKATTIAYNKAVKNLRNRSYMNPFSHPDTPALASESLGKYNLYNATGNFTLNTSTTANDKTYYIFQPSSSGSYSVHSFTTTNQGLSQSAQDSGPLLSLTTKPVRYRVSRCGLKIANVSRADSVQGVVKVLSLSQPLEWDFVGSSTTVSPTFATEVAAMFNNHPDVIEYSAHDLINTKTFICSPASVIDFNSYRAFDSGSTITDIQNSLKSNLDLNPFNVLLLEFSHTADVQTYNIDTRLQACLKFPANDLLSHFAIGGHVVSPLVIKQIKESLEGSGFEIVTTGREAIAGIHKIPSSMG